MDIIPSEIVDHKMASIHLKNVASLRSREMQPPLVTSFDSLGTEISKLKIHILINFKLHSFYMIHLSIPRIINQCTFIILVVLSNAEGSKITVEETGGALLKIFLHVLADKVIYLSGIDSRVLGHTCSPMKNL